MKKQSLLLLTLLVVTVFSNCTKKSDVKPVAPVVATPSPTPTVTASRSVYSGFPETFESGSKGSYTAADVSLATGTWNLDDALVGNTSSDRKNGSKSVRMQNTGKITMQFNKTSGAYQVSVVHAKYGSDATSTWGLWYSVNSGSTWTQTGGNITTSSTTLATSTFSMNIDGNVRFQLRKLSGGRLNIDDLSITDNIADGGAATRDDNMAMGNPSSATTNVTNVTNYLMVKTQYALAYNNPKGMANWVSWHLSTAWKGAAERCDCFTQDATLPSGYFRAATSNYTSTGFDRGHLCPSDDRDGSDADNSATFKMTNISPQAPQMNQVTWGNLETYCRTLITQGNELYIIAGAYGTGGSGSYGGTTNSIASGQINVPSRYWKVIIVLPVGGNDLTRVSSATRVIAVDMPNTQSVTSQSWGYYRTTTDAIEAATGYNFFSNVSTSIQGSIESVVDSGPTN